MITKRKAKEWVYDLTIKSLRNKNVRTADIGGAATQKDVVKVREAMLELADKLERQIRRPTEEPEEPETEEVEGK